MINTLYISYDGMTDPLGESQVIPYLKGIAKAGFSITILSAEKKDSYNKRSQKIRRMLDEYNISWHPVKYNSWPPVFSTLSDIRQMKNVAFRLHKKLNFRIVHCRSYIPSLIGLRMKERFGVRFIFDMRGFWADERIDGGLWNLKNPIFSKVYKFFKKKEEDFFNNADVTISLTQAGKDEILSWKNIRNQPIKIEVIPCCTDFDLFNRNNIGNKKIADYKKELGISEKDLVLTYLGSIGTWYMLDEMLDFFKVMVSIYKESKFLFITRDSKSRIHDLALSKGVDVERVLIKPAEREDIPSLLSISSISIFLIKPVFSKKASSPTKQGELMGLGIPLICNSGVGDVDFIINKYKVGEVIKRFNSEEYTRVVKSIEKLINIERNSIIEAGKDFYDVRQGIEKYIRIYENLL